MIGPTFVLVVLSHRLSIGYYIRYFRVNDVIIFVQLQFHDGDEFSLFALLALNLLLLIDLHINMCMTVLLLLEIEIPEDADDEVF